jgi:hypothetical protein
MSNNVFFLIAVVAVAAPMSEPAEVLIEPLTEVKTPWCKWDAQYFQGG